MRGIYSTPRIKAEYTIILRQNTNFIICVLLLSIAMLPADQMKAHEAFLIIPRTS